MADEDEGVTVVGSGEARAMPNAFEFFARVGGAAELGGDALAKFREFKRRTMDAVEKLQLADSQVAAGGFSLTSAFDDSRGQMLFFRMDDAEEEPVRPGIVFSSLLRVTVRGIDRLPSEQAPEKISQLFDQLKDNGVEIASIQANAEAGEFDLADGFNAAPLAVFVIEDASELRRLARKRAFEAAKQSAAELADLAGVELGSVVSIQDVGSVAASPWTGFVQDPFDTPRGADEGKLRLTSRTMSEIAVRTRLRVRFELKAKNLAGERLSAKQGTPQ
jgi:uncharacterized protein YggE